ncbi:MAG TPA: hypothetical protein VFH56_16040 [Acidimicrobiales bacterium]|nr:hypothetical protein [Acidimicrobiales bacterium]
MSIATDLDKLLGAWRLTDGEGDAIRSGSDVMSDLVDDIMRVVRDSLATSAADAAAAHVRDELGGAR